VETVEGVRSRDISISWTTPDGTTVMSKNMTTTGRVARRSLIFLVSPPHIVDSTSVLVEYQLRLLESTSARVSVSLLMSQSQLPMCH
jgi:hypothetical protein